MGPLRKLAGCTAHLGHYVRVIPREESGSASLNHAQHRHVTTLICVSIELACKTKSAVRRNQQTLTHRHHDVTLAGVGNPEHVVQKRNALDFQFVVFLVTELK